MNEVALKLNAGNDSNGNPRRVFIVIDSCNGDIVDAIDEGYSGSSELYKRYPDVNYSSTTINIVPSEYKTLIKHYNK